LGGAPEPPKLKTPGAAVGAAAGATVPKLNGLLAVFVGAPKAKCEVAEGAAGAAAPVAPNVEA
jgi:hypothetical protein